MRVISAMPHGGQQYAANFHGAGTLTIDERAEQRYHHGGQSGEKSRFGSGGELEADGLKRIPGKQENAGEAPPASDQRGLRGWLQELRKRTSRTTVARVKRKARNRTGDDIAQSLLDNHECGTPDEGIEDQGRFRAPLDAHHCAPGGRGRN